MTPTLSGRIQTRILMALFIGVPWTLIITPFLRARCTRPRSPRSG